MSTKEFDLIDGKRGHACFSIQRGITANCGMNSLQGFSFMVANPPPPPGQWPTTPTYKECRELFSLIEKEVVGWVVSEMGQRLTVLSDCVITTEEGKVTASRESTHPIGTGDLIKLLIKYKAGSITLSPLMRNYTYREGYHEIQAAFWVPPAGVSGIAMNGKAMPIKRTRKAPEAVRAYNKWMRDAKS